MRSLHMTQHITASVVRPLISDDREHITLHIDAPDAAPISVSFNRDLLRRVLDSLVWLESAPHATSQPPRQG